MAKQRLFAGDLEPRHLFLRIIQDLTGLHSRIGTGLDLHIPP